jgi:hypothetical protein
MSVCQMLLIISIVSSVTEISQLAITLFFATFFFKSFVKWAWNFFCSCVTSLNAAVSHAMTAVERTDGFRMPAKQTRELPNLK